MSVTITIFWIDINVFLTTWILIFNQCTVSKLHLNPLIRLVMCISSNLINLRYVKLNLSNQTYVRHTDSPSIYSIDMMIYSEKWCHHKECSILIWYHCTDCPSANHLFVWRPVFTCDHIWDCWDNAVLPSLEMPK